MPVRLIREDIISSDRIDLLDCAAEVFYRRLLNKVDDYGLYDARLSILRANLYPLRIDRVREADITRWIAACEKAGVIALYSHGDKPYLQVLRTRWQARSEPKFPLPPWGKDAAPEAVDKSGQTQPENTCEQVKTDAHLDVFVVEDVFVKTNTPPTPKGEQTEAGAKRFPEFWAAWPKHERKQDKAKCLAKWKRERLDVVADAILADIQTKTQTRKWQDGFIEAPLVYLNGKRWEDGVQPQSADDSGGVAAPWHETRSGIEGVGKELGIGLWDEGREQWFPYRDRVFAAARAAGKPMPVRRAEGAMA